MDMITYFREINEYKKAVICIVNNYFMRLIYYINAIYVLFYVANVFGTSGIFFYGKILSLTVEMAEKLILLGFTAILLLRKCGYI